jgi:hypothetical protein
MTRLGDFLGMAFQALDDASPTGLDVPAELFDISLTRLPEFLHTGPHGALPFVGRR